jgi:hypothetical protein
MRIWIFVGMFSGSGIMFDTMGGDYLPLSAQAFSAASVFLFIALLFGLKDSFRAWRMHWHWTDSANDRRTSV